MNITKSILTFLAKKQVYGLAIIIISAFVIYRIGKYIINKIIISSKDNYERKKRITIVNLLSNIFKYAIYIFVFLFVLDLYGVDTRALIASLGVVGAVLGLALQDTIKDFISGITIILDNYYVVGDIVNYNGFLGQVIDMGLKVTKIKQFNGEVLTVANRKIDEIINISQKNAHVFIDIPVAYELKTKKVEQALNTVIEQAKKIVGVKEESKYLGISDFEDSSIKYTIVVICNQDNQWQIRREVLKIIKETFEEQNIKIPYQQIEVHQNERI